MQSNTHTQTNTGPLGTEPFYSKTESWGPCPPGDKDGCQLNVSAYASGQFYFTNAFGTGQLIDKSAADRMIELIRTSKIMDVECSASQQPQDYSVKRQVSLDGVTKNFDTPACDPYFKEIDALIPPRSAEEKDLGAGYSIRGTQVYYEGKVIEGADPATFSVIQTTQDGKTEIFGQDANHVYLNGQATGQDPKSFKPSGGLLL